MKLGWIALFSSFLVFAALGLAEAQSETPPPTATMRQLMLDLIYPASNDLLVHIYRGGPKDEGDWAAVRRDAVTLEESGNLLMMPGRARDQEDWAAHVKMLVNAGTAAYKAAGEKNPQALAAVAAPLDAACTTCHQEYRPNVYPPKGGSK